jgi:hypothetical protein
VGRVAVLIFAYNLVSLTANTSGKFIVLSTLRLSRRSYLFSLAVSAVTAHSTYFTNSDIQDFVIGLLAATEERHT